MNLQWIRRMVLLGLFFGTSACRSTGASESYRSTFEKAVEQPKDQSQASDDPCPDIVDNLDTRSDSRWNGAQSILLDSCRTLIQGKAAITTALNSADDNTKTEFALAGTGSLSGNLRKFLAEEVFASEKLDKLLDSSASWGVGASLGELVAVGIDAISFGKNSMRKADAAVSIYAFTGLQVGSPWSAYGIKTFGCSDPSAYEGGFVSGPFLNLGVAFDTLPENLMAAAVNLSENEMKLLRDETSRLRNARSLTTALLLDNGIVEYALYGIIQAINLTSMGKSAIDLDINLNLDADQLKSKLKNLNLATRRTSILGALSDRLEKATHGEGSKYPFTTALVAFLKRSSSRCDSLSLGLPNAFGVTWFVRVAELSANDFNLITSGNPQLADLQGPLGGRLISSFALLSMPIRVLDLLTSGHTDVKR